MRLQRYLVYPRPGDGYSLTGPRLPFALWYQTAESAVSYAHWLMRDTGGQVTVLDRTGYPVVTERVDGTQESTQYGRQVAF